MIRQLWKMSFPASMIAKAAAKCLKYHEDRVRFYVAGFAKAEKELRKKGIDMAEVEAFLASGSIMAANYNNSYKVNCYVQPKFDQKIVERINECNHKINSHREKANEFTRYHRAFEVGVERQVELDADDINFFRLWENVKKGK